MELHQIRYFLAVVRERHFSRAALACNVTQPSLTRAVQKLEDELGGLLFDRKPGRIELTELGRQVLPHLESALQSTLTAKQEAASLARSRSSRLRLGVMCTIGPWQLAPFVTDLVRRSPGLEFEQREFRGSVVLDELMTDMIDVAFIGLPSYPDLVHAKPLYRERYVVACPPRHRFLAMAAVPAAELDAEPYLDRLNCEFLEFYREHIGDWPFKLDIRFESEREDWIQAMILAGMGCAIIPERLPLLPGIETRPLVEPAVVRQISMATQRGRPFPPAVESFVRAVQAFPWRSGDRAE